MFFAQIETKKGVGNIDGIVNVPGWTVSLDSELGLLKKGIQNMKAQVG